jgi:hypothetical protein
MNCRRFAELIPLYVEGDLAERELSRVRSHLQACAACRARADEYEASQAWLRAAEPPDFAEAFVDSVRLGVMRELAATEAPPLFERLKVWFAPRRLAAATVALTAIFIALALLIYQGRSRSGHHDSEVATGEPAPPVEKMVEGPRPALVAGPAPAHRPRRRTTPNRDASLATRTRRDAGHTSAPHDQLVAQHAPETVPAAPADGGNAATNSAGRLRIEIQTADPNIRIIWFAPKPTDGEAPKPMRETL